MLANGNALLAGYEPLAGGGVEAELEELNLDGSVDTAFGNGGIVIPPTKGQAYYGVVAESNGTIVAVGSSNGDVLLAGYNAAGSVDTSFGTAGQVIFPISGASNSTAYSVTLDAGGNLVIVGSASGAFGSGVGRFRADRFTAAGKQDHAFNGGAPLLFGTNSDDDVLGKVIQSTSDIVAAGSSAGNVVVVEIKPVGALNTSFGTGGIVKLSELASTNLPSGQQDYTEGLALDSAGRILVANHTPSGHFGTVRLTPTGSLDTTFGTVGLARLPDLTSR